MKKKTSELTGAELDYAVAVALGKKVILKSDGDGHRHCLLENNKSYNGMTYLPSWEPSVDWSQGGPIVEQEGISLSGPTKNDSDRAWFASFHKMNGTFAEGETPLIAAMRCFVASKLGEEVEIP